MIEKPEPLVLGLADRIVKFGDRPTRAAGQDLSEELSELENVLEEAASQLSTFVENIENWLDEDAERDDRADARIEIENDAAGLAESLRELTDKAT